MPFLLLIDQTGYFESLSSHMQWSLAVNRAVVYQHRTLLRLVQTFKKSEQKHAQKCMKKIVKTIL